MLGRVGAVGVLFAVLGCTHRILLQDAVDAYAPSPIDTRDASLAKDLGVEMTVGDSHPGAVLDANDATDVGVEAPYGGRCKKLQFVQKAPSLSILFDRSQIMHSNLPGPPAPTTRIAATDRALRFAIKARKDVVNFTLELFPTSRCLPTTCCAGIFSSPLTFFKDSEIADLIGCGGDSSMSCPEPTTADSPSHAALARFNDVYASMRSDGQTYVLLVTPSNPKCDAAGEGKDPPCKAAQDAIDILKTSKIRFMVLSVGDMLVGNPCLFDLTQRTGRTPDPAGTKTLYTPMTADDVSRQVNEMVLAVARNYCTLYLVDPARPADEQSLVSVGTVELQKGAETRGWSFFKDPDKPDQPPDPSRIVLSHDTCDEYLTSPSTHKISVFDCP